MRELKFRAWDKHFFGMCPIAGIKFKDKSIIVETNPEGDECSYFEHGVGGFLMQYTGLKDKRGVEIYEGDIIKAYPYGWPQPGQKICICAVVFSELEGMWVLKDERPLDACPALFSDNTKHAHDLEIIGNIYQNPELLEVKCEN